MASDAAVPRRVVPLVVVGQLLVLGVWFSGSAALPSMSARAGSSDAGVALLLAAVQVGFVVGTLTLGALQLADRIAPTRVFLVAASLAALANAALLADPGVGIVLVARFVTGVALAGVYPVGMKILATWYPRPGWALGFLVGALALGSGSPYLVRAAGAPWMVVVGVASALALGGALLVGLLVREGPRLPRASRFDPRAFPRAMRDPVFRRAALGYFGHMWELYAFWGLAPLFLAAAGVPDAGLAPIVFAIFLVGALASAGAGLLARRVGEARVAVCALALSGLACMLSPLAFLLPAPMLVTFVLVWAAVVVADSAQFSALVAQAAPREHVGTALTLQNAIGFAITFGSLTLVPLLASMVGWRWAFLALAPGPVLGVIASWSLARASNRESVPS